jgi:hypothetical protein
MAVRWRSEMGEDRWYQELRDRYRPDQLRLLLIGESAPDPRSGDRRFFYAPTLTHDTLYRGVAAALLGESDAFDIRAKTKNLERMKAAGVWLIDAVDAPVNARTTSERRRAIRDNAPVVIERCRQLDPSIGIAICHSVVYDELAPLLRSARLRVVHDTPLPFPLGNTRARFVAGLRAALAAAGVPTPLEGAA